jgi:hypothetical protein
MDDRGNCRHGHPALIVVLAILEYPPRGQTLFKKTHPCWCLDSGLSRRAKYLQRQSQLLIRYSAVALGPKRHGVCSLGLPDSAGVRDSICQVIDWQPHIIWQVRVTRQVGLFDGAPGSITCSLEITRPFRERQGSCCYQLPFRTCSMSA